MEQNHLPTPPPTSRPTSARRTGQRRQAAQRATDLIATQSMVNQDRILIFDLDSRVYRTELELPTIGRGQRSLVDQWKLGRTNFSAQIRENMEEFNENEPNSAGFSWIDRRKRSLTPLREVSLYSRRLDLDENGNLIDSIKTNLEDLKCLYCCETAKIPQFCNECHQFVGCQSCLLRWYCAEDSWKNVEDVAVLIDTIEQKSSHCRCPLCNQKWTGCPNTRPTFHRRIVKRSRKDMGRGQDHRLECKVDLEQDLREWEEQLEKHGNIFFTL